VKRKRGDKLLFRYSRTALLRFDYWVGGDAKRILIQVASARTGQLHNLWHNDIVRDTWGHLAVPLSAVGTATSSRSPAPLEEGEPVGVFAIASSHIGESPFYVDNIKVSSPYRSTMEAQATQP
jgi:hypothetical protein